MTNRIGTTVSLTLLTAVLTMGFVLVGDTVATAADGDNTTMSKLAGRVDGEAAKSGVDEQPAASTAKRAADRALERELKQPEPKTTGAITSLSTLSDGPSDSSLRTASSSNFGNRSRGYSAWRKGSDDSTSEQVASKKTLPQHAPPKRADDAAAKSKAKQPAAKAAPARPAKPAAKAAPAAKPAVKPAAKATAAPRSVAASVESKAPSASKSAMAASVTPETPTAKKTVATAAATTESAKSAATASSTPASTSSSGTRSWRSRVSVAPKATSSPEQKVEAKPAPKPAPVVASSTSKTVATKAPAPKPATVSTSTAPVRVAPAAKTTKPVVVAGGKQGATRGGAAMQPSATENPPAGGSLIARGAKGGAPNIMRVLTGKSIMVDLAKDSKRVAVANPKVAEVLIITPKQIMVNGLADGETSIIIWDRAGNYTMSTVVVGDDLADQVMLEVTVAEINRSAMERHGVDYRNFGGQFNSITQYGGVAPTGGAYPPTQNDPPLPISLDGGISWAVIDVKNDIAVLFKQLQDENLGRVLAEPKLLSRSGKEANFLSGGEIPIVVTTNDDTSIEFKEFGTKVNFTPSVREDSTIDLLLEAEVSEPDYAGGVQLFGFQVPAFITRRSSTEVTLRDNQSLIVAGLIKETKQELESKMPFVGDIPVLGYFFRRTEYTNDILELVMVVKPRLVKPIAEGTRVGLPTDRGPLTKQEVRTGPVEEKVVRPRPY